MEKKDDIILIIAKSFSKTPLSKEECLISAPLTRIQLIEEFGLNDIQASEVINWCVISNRKLNLEKFSEPINEIFGFFKKKNVNIITKDIAKNIITNTLGTQVLLQYLHMIKIQLKNLDPKIQANVNVDDGISYENVRINPKAFQLNRLIKENLEICYSFFDDLKRNPSSFSPEKFKVIRESLESDLTAGELRYLNALERSLDEPGTSNSKSMPVTFRNNQYSMLKFSKIFNNHIKQKNSSDVSSLENFTYFAYKMVLDYMKQNNKSFKNKRDEKAIQFERENREAIIISIAEACLDRVDKTMDIFESSNFYLETKYIYNKFMTSKAKDKNYADLPFGKSQSNTGIQIGHANRER